MNKAKRKIPTFKNIKDEARFWDIHDVTDYLPEMKKVKLSFEKPTSSKQETITIRIQSSIKKRLEAIAKSYGVNVSTLARIWFIDKLKEQKQKASLVE